MPVSAAFALRQLRGTFAFKRLDRGWEKLVETARAAEARRAYVKVGVLGEAPRPAAAAPEGPVTREGKPPAAPSAPLSNLQLAAIHEFGSPARGIPQRSWIRSSIAKHRAAYAALLRKLLPRFYEGKASLEQVLGLVGARAAADIKAGVMSGPGIAPPLKPSTIARKGSSRPLVDTGRMVASVSWRVYSGSGGEGTAAAPGGAARGGGPGS